MQDASDWTVNLGSALEVLFAALKYRIVPEPGQLQERREWFLPTRGMRHTCLPYRILHEPGRLQTSVKWIAPKVAAASIAKFREPDRAPHSQERREWIADPGTALAVPDARYRPPPHADEGPSGADGEGGDYYALLGVSKAASAEEIKCILGPEC